MMGGSKKKNGHRKACKCPICKNMKNSKKRGGKSNRRTKKRRGGDEDEEEEINNDTDSDTDSSDEEEEKGEEEEEDKENEEEDKKGGRKKKRGNGHKANCKNMRKKKGGDPDEEPDIENQMGDIEEAGVKATSGSDLQTNETPASSSDYDALDSAEKGEAGVNAVGGTRKRRRGGKKWGGKKWGGKTKKARRSRRRH